MNEPAPQPPSAPPTGERRRRPRGINLEIVVITGMSGSGKSVALHALEDASYYCVDNLPPELLVSFVSLEQRHRQNRVAIVMDVRSAAWLRRRDTLRASARKAAFDAVSA